MIPLCRDSGLLLLDFDGPTCDVFHGYPAQIIAEELHDLAVNVGFKLPVSNDPMQVLSAAAAFPEVLPVLEDGLIQRETAAVDVALLTPNAARFLAEASELGVPVAVVSNNSALAIESFLNRLSLADRVAAIFGRPYRQPELMKPSPHLLNQALSMFDIAASRTCFIGDSTTDVEAARAAGTPVVALANKPGKRELFEGYADAVIEDMAELL